MLSVFANGKVFLENLFASEINSAKHYQNYLVGEIHADFLDEDDIDRATANRESIKKDDPKYQALLALVRKALAQIDSTWDDWRIALGLEKSNPIHNTLISWIEGLQDDRDKKQATKLLTSIHKTNFHSDENKNLAAQKILYHGAIVGFEKLRMRKQLGLLETIDNVLSPEFAAIFASLNDIEETAYAEITRERLAIIRKFKEIAHDPTALEKVAQKHLADNLWLLNPSWDRVTGRAEKEKTLTKYLKKQCPDHDTGARVDISYRVSSGRHVIIELKKPSITNLKFDKLSEQARKYDQAITLYYLSKEPNEPVPPLVIYLLVAQKPKSVKPESDARALAEYNATLITYTELITNAENTYQAYIDANTSNDKIQNILNELTV